MSPLSTQSFYLLSFFLHMFPPFFSSQSFFLLSYFIHMYLLSSLPNISFSLLFSTYSLIPFSHYFFLPLLHSHKILKANFHIVGLEKIILLHNGSFDFESCFQTYIYIYTYIIFMFCIRPCTPYILVPYKMVTFSSSLFSFLLFFFPPPTAPSFSLFQSFSTHLHLLFFTFPLFYFLFRSSFHNPNSLASSFFSFYVLLSSLSVYPLIFFTSSLSV